MVMPTVLKVPDALNILDFVHIKKLPTKQEPSFEARKLCCVEQ